VRLQVFDIFQHKGARALGGDDARHVEKQRALRGIGKAMRAPQGVFLGYAGNAERLTGKTGQQDIVIRHVLCIHRGDVAGNRLPVGKVGVIGFLRVAIPFAGKDTTPAFQLEGLADAADAGKKINEGEIGRLDVLRAKREQHLLKRRNHVRLWLGFARQPAPHRGGLNT